MKKNLTERFFAELDRELGRPAEIILTGAAAGSLLGSIRPSLDIDFEIRVKGKAPATAQKNAAVAEAIQKASAKTGIDVNYSEDIGHWSMIDYLNYRQTAVPYKTIGRLKVKLMASGHWTIGKMARFLEIDVNDLVKVIKKKKLAARDLILLWSRALKASPLSPALETFRDHVVYFLEKHGKSVWGKNFDPDEAVFLFRRRIGQK